MEDLHDAFGDHVAVDGVDLALAPGEVFGLLGPNGAGKTTTLRVIRGRVSFAQVSTQWGYRPTECSPGEAT